jgi:nucleotide-binding universal stress UspA family protein
MKRQFLVALDSSERADYVFRYAVGLAESLGASIHLLRVVAVPPDFPPAAYISRPDELRGYLLRQAEEHLQEFAKKVPHLSVETIVHEAMQPWRAIVDVADRIGAELVVIGSHGYQGLDYLLGTNAARVADMARCNVVIVHERRRP